MKTLTTWNPFRELDQLNASLRSLSRNRGTRGESQWHPAVDVVEDESGYTLVVDLPRVDKEHVNLTFTDSVLVIEGERTAEEKKEGATTHLTERAYGKFVRSFRLPEDANGEAIEANFRDGVLTVTVPKKEESKPKSIEIKVD
jgi:HSP20 family protein